MTSASPPRRLPLVLALCAALVGGALGGAGCSHSRFLYRHHWDEIPQRYGDASYELAFRNTFDYGPDTGRAWRFELGTTTDLRGVDHSTDLLIEYLVDGGICEQLAAADDADFARLVAETMRVIRPDQPVVFIHGYNSDTMRFSGWHEDVVDAVTSLAESLDLVRTIRVFALGYPTGVNWEGSLSTQEVADSLEILIHKSLEELCDELTRRLLDALLAQAESAGAPPEGPEVDRLRYLARRTAREVIQWLTFSIVCHSTGGVVVKHYLARHRYTHRLSNVVMVNVPHYGANWAGAKAWIIRLKDIGAILRSLNPIPMIVRTHVPELERQISELAYASTLQIELDRRLLEHVADWGSPYPHLVAIGSQHDEVVRCASATWNEDLVEYQEIWLGMSHSDFSDPGYGHATAERIAHGLMLPEQVTPERLHEWTPRKSKVFVAALDAEEVKDRRVPVPVVLTSWDSIVAVEPGDPLVARAATIPGALLVAADRAPADSLPGDQWFSDAATEVYVDLCGDAMDGGLPTRAWIKAREALLRFVPKLWTPSHFGSNLVNGLHFHRDCVPLRSSIDYFYLDFYRGVAAQWRHTYDLAIANHYSALVGQDYVLISNPYFILTRNVIVDLLLPDALFHLVDYPSARTPGVPPRVVVAPARTTVLDVRAGRDRERAPRLFVTPELPLDPSIGGGGGGDGS